MKIAIRAFVALLTISYPFAIYFGLNYFEPKYLALFLLLILFVRFVADNNMIKDKKQLFSIALISLVICVVAFFSNSIAALKLYPVVVSLSFLMVFFYSLIFPPTVIERLARLSEPELPEKGVRYTRLVTKLWCSFFVLNALIASYTVFFMSDDAWLLYNGFISYLLMGCLFSGELLYRKFFLKK